MEEEKISEAIGRVSQGRMLNASDYTKDEYLNHLRSKLQDRAGKYIDYGDGLRAQIFLMEVSRLDKALGVLMTD